MSNNICFLDFIIYDWDDILTILKFISQTGCGSSIHTGEFLFVKNDKLYITKDWGLSWHEAKGADFGINEKAFESIINLKNE